MRRVLTAGLIGLGLMPAAPAFADVSESNFVDMIGFGDEQTVHGTNASTLLGSSASLTGGPTATVSVATTNDYYRASAQQNVTYAFHINVDLNDLAGIAPGSDRATIPLLITYAGSASTVGHYSSAVIALDVNDSITGGLYDDVMSCNQGQSCSWSKTGAFNFAYAFDGGGGVTTTDTGTVTLQAYGVAQATDTAPYSGYSAHASIDPTISFAPEFLARHPNATITVDAVPTAPVPEPGVWAMMASGLAGVGLAARRRRRRA